MGWVSEFDLPEIASSTTVWRVLTADIHNHEPEALADHQHCDRLATQAHGPIPIDFILPTCHRFHMITLSPLRWGKPYESSRRFMSSTLIRRTDGQDRNRRRRDRDARICVRRQSAREALRQIPVTDLLEMCKKASELFKSASLPVGDSMQSVDDLCINSLASTGLPEHMCRGNMDKNAFRAFQHGPHPRLSHAWLGPIDPDSRLWRRRAAVSQ